MMISDIQEQECIDQCIGIPIYRTIYRNRNALINALEFLYKNHIIYRNSDALINASEFLYKKHLIYRNSDVLIKYVLSRLYFDQYIGIIVIYIVSGPLCTNEYLLSCLYERAHFPNYNAHCSKGGTELKFQNQIFWPKHTLLDLK